MTEAEWLACADPGPMLDFLDERVTERKARLLVCACCRRLWRLLKDGRSRQAVSAAEEYADGLLGHDELAAVGRDAGRARRTKAARAAAAVAAGETFVYWLFPYPSTRPRYESGLWAAWARQVIAEMSSTRDAGPVVALVRELFGNPFRPVALVPSWRTADAVMLAEAAYQERALPAGTLDRDRLGLLADALLDGGCSDTDLLGHLRSEGPHVRGCWALDRCLGRE